jgi:hypothetical protein
MRGNALKTGIHTGSCMILCAYETRSGWDRLLGVGSYSSGSLADRRPHPSQCFGLSVAPAWDDDGSDISQNSVPNPIRSGWGTRTGSTGAGTRVSRDSASSHGFGSTSSLVTAVQSEKLHIHAIRLARNSLSGCLPDSIGTLSPQTATS